MTMFPLLSIFDTSFVSNADHLCPKCSLRKLLDFGVQKIASEIVELKMEKYLLVVRGDGGEPLLT